MEHTITRVTTYVVSANTQDEALQVFNARYANGLGIQIKSEHFAIESSDSED